MRFPLCPLALAATLAGTAGAAAETYPSRPITMSVPYAAGGPLDTLARILTERLRVVLGQSGHHRECGRRRRQHRSRPRRAITSTAESKMVRAQRITRLPL